MQCIVFFEHLSRKTKPRPYQSPIKQTEIYISNFLLNVTTGNWKPHPGKASIVHWVTNSQVSFRDWCHSGRSDANFLLAQQPQSKSNLAMSIT